MLKYLLELFDWCKVAIFLQNKKSNVLFKEGEIWWCRIGLNIGVEIFGKGNQFVRPVLISKKLNSQSFLGIPLTSQAKDGNWYVPIQCGGKEVRAILSQIKVFDQTRLMKKMETVPNEDFKRIKQAFLDFYGE